ncbi:hypothetical protein ASE04_19115 [Rhizobium sp. Root708]|uniref:hypothetical protein n=1 Tax=Rhizobium sp. Root708 TaxID=1736592 RepID=UPI0006F70FBB|nr:hypothetical protein [Rhizobium sp. Root708]KRB49277.1 hypothetical protein ASE04_19115 [Rhizobium sp. Root708]
MFGIHSADTICMKGQIAEVASMVATAIAYEQKMGGASITVTDDCGVLVLEGQASPTALAFASDIAAAFVGSRYCNLIKPL